MLPPEYRKGIKFSEHIPETMKQFIFQHRAAAARGAVGGLALLLVALTGLANMLLVSVGEQMREMGLRRALGALRSDIGFHFLLEGVMLSGVGAAGGLLVGAFACWAARVWTGLPIPLSLFWAVTGPAVAVVAGTLVSVLPAVAAARLPPAAALRCE
jgi:ABC-type antimicrobial peptide transport system permease subunit